MFGQNREKKRFSWRWAVLLVALVAGSLLLAACGDSDPSPTATPEPTPVQATPDKDDDTMMDEDDDTMMDEDADAMMDEDADAMMDEDADAMMDEDADAMMDEDADAMMDEDADAMMDEDADAMMDEDADAMMDEDADAMMDEDADAMTDEDADAMMDEDADAMMDEDADAMMDEDADAMMDEDADAMMDEDADAMMDEDADAMMDEDADAMMDEDADAMMDEDADAMMDEDADAMMDEDADAMMDEDADAMMDEDADAMMDEDADAMMSLSDIDETTTGAELIASLSEGEADCLRAAIGDASYEAMQDLTLSESAMGFDTFPLQCLEPDNAIDLSVAMMSLQAGGLSDDSQACIKDVFADLGVPGEGMSMTDSMRSFITMQLCLTDEEAQAMSGPVPEEDAFPLPSQLRCVSEQTDLENLFIVYQAFADLESSTEPPTPSPEMTKAVAEIMAAQETCGIPTIIQGEGSAP